MHPRPEPCRASSAEELEWVCGSFRWVLSLGPSARARPVPLPTMKPIPIALVLVILGVGLFLWLQPEEPGGPSIDGLESRIEDPDPARVESPLPTPGAESSRSAASVALEPEPPTRSPGSTTLPGRVVTHEGRPAPGAKVLVTRRGDIEGGSPTVFDDGSFELEVGPGAAELRLHARHPDHAPSAQVSLAIDALPSEITLRLGGPGASVVGIVIDPFGNPIGAALVELGQPAAPWVPRDSEGRTETGPRPKKAQPTGTLLEDGSTADVAPPLRVLSDEQGRFEARGLAAEWMPVRASAEGHMPLTVAVVPTVEVPAPLRLVLHPCGRVEGTVFDIEGDPVEGARISARPLDDSARAPWGASARSDEGGRFALEPLESGIHAIVAESPGMGIASLEVDVLVDRVIQCDIHLGPPGSSGRLLRGDGRPLVGWSVGLVLSEEQTLGSSPTDAEGRFQLPADPAHVRRKLAVTDPRGIPRPLAEEVHTGPDLESGLELRVDVMHCPSAWIRGRVASTAGELPTRARLRVHEQLVQHGFEHPLDGSDTGAFDFRIGPLLPGSLRLDGLGPGFGSARLAELELEVDGEHDLGTLGWPGSGELEIELIAEDRAFERTLYYMILQKQGDVVSDLVDGAGSPPSPLELWPGVYEVALFSDGFLAPDATVEVRAGEVERLELELRPGARYAFAVTLPDGVEPSSPVELLWIQRGETRPRHRLWLDEPPFSGRVDLEVGDYRLVASSEQGRWFEDFEWTGKAQAAPRTVVLRPVPPPGSDDELDDF